MTREMKYSGVEWIGDIPSEWKIIKNKYLLDSLYSGGTPTSANENFYSENGIPFVSISDMSKANYLYNTKKKLTEAGIQNKKLKILPIGTILYSIYATIGEVSELKVEATISQALLALNINERIDNQYYKYNLEAMKEYIFANANGNTQFNLNAEKVWNFVFVFPSLLEQKKIADFLDGKVSEIDKIIAETKSSIENYKEYKQSVITEAVTKGLDKNVPMKDSGIEWIGDIPSEWKVVRIKNTSSLRGRIGWQGLKTSDYQDNGAYLITGTDFRNGIINWQTCVHISDERFVEDENIHIYENDLLITKDGTIGKVAIAKNCPEKVSLNSGVLLIRNDKNIKYNGLYMYFMLNSNVFWKWYNSNQMGNSTIKHLYQGQFENFSFPLPKLNEQTQIAEYLDIKCTEIENSISEKEQLISNLEEYKKSLIYEYVTGKRTVE